MPAKSRSSEIASMLERFLDDNEDNLPPVMFIELDNLAGDIDTVAYNLETEIDELKEELREEKMQLEKELEEK